MEGDPKFVILSHKSWLDAEKFENAILGAIVRLPLKPTVAYEPNTPLRHNKEELVEGHFTEFLLDTSSSSSRDASATLGLIKNISWKGNTDASQHLTGKVLRLKQLQQHDRFWQSLRTDPDVLKVVPGWISATNPWPPCLVVGIMIAEEVELNNAGNTERHTHGEVEVPLASVAAAAAGFPAAGLGSILGGGGGSDVGKMAVGLDSGRQVATGFQAKSQGSKIFALELRVVTNKWLRRRELKLMDDGPKVKGGRLAGDGKGSEARMEDEEDGDEEEKADLILGMLTEKDYEEMKN